MKKIKRIIAVAILIICMLLIGYISHTCKALKNNETATANTVAAEFKETLSYKSECERYRFSRGYLCHTKYMVVLFFL